MQARTLIHDRMNVRTMTFYIGEHPSRFRDVSTSIEALKRKDSVSKDSLWCMKDAVRASEEVSA